jgi:hypothetical protein
MEMIYFSDAKTMEDLKADIVRHLRFQAEQFRIQNSQIPKRGTKKLSLVLCGKTEALNEAADLIQKLVLTHKSFPSKEVVLLNQNKS